VIRKISTSHKRRGKGAPSGFVLCEQFGHPARAKEKLFFEAAERFRASQDPAETKRLGEELGRFVFGE